MDNTSQRSPLTNPSYCESGTSCMEAAKAQGIAELRNNNRETRGSLQPATAASSLPLTDRDTAVGRQEQIHDDRRHQSRQSSGAYAEIADDDDEKFWRHLMHVAPIVSSNVTKIALRSTSQHETRSVTSGTADHRALARELSNKPNQSLGDALPIFRCTGF